MNYFNYNDKNDKEIYFSDNKSIQDKSVKILAVTTAGDQVKPNEDSFAIRIYNNSIWVAVFDGTTSLKPIQSLKESGARFASHFLKKSFYEITLDTPRKVLVRLNNALLKENIKLGGNLNNTHTLPASLGTIAKLDLAEREISFTHIGDTYAILYDTLSTSTVITDDKNIRFDNQMFKLIKKVAIEKHITNKEARNDPQIKDALIVMFIERNNNPNKKGSGVINGDPNMEKYIFSNNYKIKDQGSLLIGTDGLEVQGKDINESDYRLSLKHILQNGGFEQFVKLKRESEDNDPDWKYVRYKHSDDATGVYINWE